MFTMISSLVTYIAATDTRLCNMNADIFRASESWHWPVFERDVSNGS
jgi:hypothetical protein